MLSKGGKGKRGGPSILSLGPLTAQKRHAAQGVQIQASEYAKGASLRESPILGIAAKQLLLAACSESHHMNLINYVVKRPPRDAEKGSEVWGGRI